MRILHVYSGNLYGGIERILATIASARHVDPAVDHQFALCFTGRLARELAACRVTLHDLTPVRVSRPQTVVAARAALSRILAQGRFDRVICHGPWSHGLFGPLVCRAGLPLVFWAHDTMSGSHWTERLARRVTPDLVVCNSQYTAATLPALFSGLSATVIYAPVPMPTAPISTDDRQHLRAACQTDPHATVIVQASRCEAWKGHEVLADALGRLSPRFDWVWWFVGGPQRPAEAAFLTALRERAVRLGIAEQVRWLGERDDVPRFLGAADLFCQPNTSPEPFGIVFVEALAAGLPVVATRLGGACEIVTDNCGLLVEPHDPDALASVLKQLLDCPALRQRLAATARDRARALCDPDTQMRALHHALATVEHAGVGS